MTPAPKEPAMQHELVDGTLHRTDQGIIGRCKCGWNTGYRFSSFAASAEFMDHQERAADRQPREVIGK